ncbi:MAG: peptidylprolyl isomerase [Sulfurovum sp.]|nr:peptidylprolyl isomerase [Sulfurovum sp.]
MKMIKNTLLVLALSATVITAGDVLATVNDKKVTTKDAERFIRASNPQQTLSSLSDSDKKIVTDRLIERILFIEAAQKAGVEKAEEFKKALAVAKDELMINQWMKNQFEATVVSDGEAKDFYEKNKEKYQKPAQVRARHILLKEDEAGAKKIVEELKGLKGDKLKEKFIELAKSKSEGPTGSKGGDLGFFADGQMVPEFSKAAFALEKGKITEAPVKTDFGYHIIYIEDKKDAAQVPYDQVKEQIVQNLKQTQFREMIEKSAKELKSKAKIVIETEKK